jgi:hypothetical protein
LHRFRSRKSFLVRVFGWFSCFSPYRASAVINKLWLKELIVGYCSTTRLLFKHFVISK